MAVVGVIGGSGLDDPEILKSPKDVDVETPFGRPSSPLREGTISGTKVYLLAATDVSTQSLPRRSTAEPIYPR